VKCGEAGHEGASCSHQELCINYKGKHAASSRECLKWKLEKRVQQLKVERGISFPDARKAALSEQSTNTSSKRTAASVVSGSTTATTQRRQKSTVSIAIPTELTWPQGTDTPVTVKVNSETTQTYSNEDNTKNIEKPPLLTTSPSPPPRSNRGGNAAIASIHKSGQGDPHPLSSSSSSKKNGKPKINRPPPHTMYSRYGVLDVEGGGDSDAG